MTYVSKKQFSMIFSSAPENGALNISEDGSSFSVSLDKAISFPYDAFDCTAEVSSASVWNTVPNISPELRNNMFYYFHGPDSTLYTVTFPRGLFSVESFLSEISKSLINQGLPPDAIYITGNQSTQKIVLSFPYIGSYVDFTGVSSCREVLGFDSRFSPVTPTTLANQSENGDKPAHFNSIESYFIKTDLINGNIPTNKISDQTIANVPITAQVGTLIMYNPINAIRCDANSLKGPGKTYCTFRLTDEKNKPARTNEDFSLLIVFRYSMRI
jgi:hypothetical protein